MRQDLIVSYGDDCLVVKSSPETLNAFIAQLKTNSAFVESVFKQALDRQQAQM
ncbi:MAG: hypothetical protein QNJ72_21880 [Pleurocapsa sp. MO_226.B13]|nr:hypothetical protein [Pleurocapsa sp. MO_226.B13]